MIQKWRKLGRILVPSGDIEWMQSHAAVPIAEHVVDDVYRIHFSARDATNRSTMAYVTVDLARPTEVIECAAEPTLGPGGLGAFDDSGAMGSWLLSDKGVTRLYYVGWNLGVTVPFRNAIGLAERRGQNPFSRVFEGPIVDRTPEEPHFCASCCVLRDGDLWRMWYTACTGWRLVAGAARHDYHIRYAESEDGIAWRRTGHVAIDFENPGEYAFSRPCVLRDGDTWKMWYSYRGDRYRVGYAESRDGLSWSRRDSLVDLEPTEGDWDSKMIAYPYVFDHAGVRYMLYNGDGYGKTGFGLARLESG